MIHWPHTLRPIDGSQPWLDHASTSAGRTFGGGETIIKRDARWKASYQFKLRNSAEVLLARALMIKADGRAGVFQIPVFDCGRGPGAVNWSRASGAVPHSDGSTHSDGAEYLGAIYPAYTVSLAPLRSTSLTINAPAGAARLSPGHYFSINGFLYAISGVSVTSETEAVIQFRPPLREAVTAGAYVEFDHPTGRFRLATDDVAKIALASMRFGSIDLQLDEAL